MRENCTYGLTRGRAYPTRGVPLYSTSVDIVIDFVMHCSICEKYINKL